MAMIMAIIGTQGCGTETSYGANHGGIHADLRHRELSIDADPQQSPFVSARNKTKVFRLSTAADKRVKGLYSAIAIPRSTATGKRETWCNTPVIPIRGVAGERYSGYCRATVIRLSAATAMRVTGRYSATLINIETRKIQ